MRRTIAMARGCWRMDAAERRTTLAAAVAVPAIALALRIVDFKRTLGWIESRPLGASQPSAMAHDVGRITRAVTRARRYSPSPGNCLSGSLALLWLLRRAGVAAHLQLGANRVDGVVAAHAWVEHDGVVLNDTADVTARYAPFEAQAR